jgi:hypothetical protein
MRFVAWLKIAEPELNVPVTVRVYVPARVPPPPGLPPPPPHEEEVIRRNSKLANAIPRSSQSAARELIDTDEVVARGVPFQLIVAPETKPEPRAVSVKLDPAGELLEGDAG